VHPNSAWTDGHTGLAVPARSAVPIADAVPIASADSIASADRGRYIARVDSGGVLSTDDDRSSSARAKRFDCLRGRGGESGVEFRNPSYERGRRRLSKSRRV